MKIDIEEVEFEPHGIDALLFTIKFMAFIGEPEKKKLDDAMNVITDGLKRKLTATESVSFMDAVNNFLNAKPETPERMEATLFLFNLKFIE